MSVQCRNVTSKSLCIAALLVSITVGLGNPAGASSQRQRMIAWSKPFLVQMDKYEANAQSLEGVIASALVTKSVARLLSVAGQMGNEAQAIDHMQTSPSAALNNDVYKIAVAIQQVGRDLLGVDIAIRFAPGSETSTIRMTTAAMGRVTGDVNRATNAIKIFILTTP